MAPATDPVALLILEDIESTLTGLSGGADYWNTAPRVQLYSGPIEFNEFPNITIVPQDARAKQFAQGATSMETWSWPIVLLCTIRTRDEPWGDAIRLVHDVEKVLKVDWTRGGIARDTIPLGYQVFLPGSEEDSITEVRMLFEIEYATDRHDPIIPR